MRVAILGATSHIARNLLRFFASDPGTELWLYARRPASVRAFLQAQGLPEPAWCGADFNGLRASGCTLVINCVGAGTPNRLRACDLSDWFSVTEHFDNLALSYLREVNPAATYVSFSSGAVYGRGRVEACTADSQLTLPVNAVPAADYYAVARLNAECKHRAMADLHILDIRIFSFFSRFAELDDGYLMTDIARALCRREPLATSPADLRRDYIAPVDLFALIQAALRHGGNIAVDAYSRESVTKMEILHAFTRHFGLQVAFAEGDFTSPNGTASVYCSAFRRAADFGYVPRCSALETLIEETERLLHTHVHA